MKREIYSEESFPGGIEAELALKELYENQDRGQYLSVILLGSMIIERQLVGLLRKEGWNASQRMKSILDAALSYGFIDETARGQLAALRHLRNTYVHFFDDSHRSSLSYRSLEVDRTDILKRDAQDIIAWVEALIERRAILTVLASGSK